MYPLPGQMVAYDIVHMTEPSCPIESIDIPISDDDPDFGRNSSTAGHLHFIRSAYDPGTGSAPNNPRKPVGKWTGSVWDPITRKVHSLYLVSNALCWWNERYSAVIGQGNMVTKY